MKNIHENIIALYLSSIVFFFIILSNIRVLIQNKNKKTILYILQKKYEKKKMIYQKNLNGLQKFHVIKIVNNNIKRASVVSILFVSNILSMLMLF